MDIICLCSICSRECCFNVCVHVALTQRNTNARKSAETSRAKLLMDWGNDAASCQADRDNTRHGAKQSCKIKPLLSLHLRYQNGLDCKAPTNTSRGQKAQPASRAPDCNATVGGVFSESALVCCWLCAT